jgi:DNA-binding response OmpR family regulator
MKKKILIIEDEKVLGEMYKDKFSQSGFDVFWAQTAEEGIEKVKKVKPDLIILDILLPKANGIGFMGWLKETDFASTPVIAFSNFDEPGTKKEALNLGVRDYLIKTNYTPQEIIDKVKKYLEQ